VKVHPEAPDAMHASLPVSPWIERWAPLVPAGGTVLDVACGPGRHTRFFARRGCRVTAVDRDADAVAALGGIAEAVVADIENGPWPFAGRAFDAVVVTNYLWRPLLPALLGAVAPGGALLYETFARGHEAFGKPSRPDFLLQPGELLGLCAGFDVVAYEHGRLEQPARIVQRIAALRPGRSPVHASLESLIPGEIK
jgi:SAM-dependent methyltransferase